MEPVQTRRKPECQPVVGLSAGRGVGSLRDRGGLVRVLIVMRAHWPRALIRATLREAGYDALGARDLDEALTYPAKEAARGSVRLILLDQRAVSGKDDPRLRQLLE